MGLMGLLVLSRARNVKRCILLELGLTVDGDNGDRRDGSNQEAGRGLRFGLCEWWLVSFLFFFFFFP